jgi:hypothetical protein
VFIIHISLPNSDQPLMCYLALSDIFSDVNRL